MSKEECNLLQKEIQEIITSNNFLDQIDQISSFESKDEQAEVYDLIVYYR